jgi:hypothetical protein
MTSEKNTIEKLSALPEQSRVWVYQCERFLTPNEVHTITEEGKKFLSSWNTHGMPLRAELIVYENLFLIMVLDEAVTEASGCSIDQSMKFISEIENYTGCSLTNRMSVSLYVDDKMMITDLNQLSHLKEKGIINENTFVFDNLVDSLAKLRNNWRVKIGESWHARFL